MRRDLLSFMATLTMLFIVGGSILVGVVVGMATNVLFGLLAFAAALVVLGLPSAIFLALIEILERLEAKDKETKIDYSISKAN